MKEAKSWPSGAAQLGYGDLDEQTTVGFGPILAMKKELIGELDRIIEAEKVSFATLMITDISLETSLLLCRGEARVINAISYPRVEDDLFEMKNVLSRKKQVLPYFVDLLKTL